MAVVAVVAPHPRNGVPGCPGVQSAAASIPRYSGGRGAFLSLQVSGSPFRASRAVPVLDVPCAQTQLPTHHPVREKCPRNSGAVGCVGSKQGYAYLESMRAAGGCLGADLCVRVEVYCVDAVAAVVVVVASGFPSPSTLCCRYRRSTAQRTASCNDPMPTCLGWGRRWMPHRSRDTGGSKPRGSCGRSPATRQLRALRVQCRKEI